MTTNILAPASDELHTILTNQRSAFLQDGPPTLEQRRADLKKFKSAMIARRKEIEEAINTDFGHRSRHETAIVEIVAVIEGIKSLSSNLKKFMAPSKRKVALHMRFGTARVEYQPLGVVGIISPWNYPNQFIVNACCYCHCCWQPGNA